MSDELLFKPIKVQFIRKSTGSEMALDIPPAAMLLFRATVKYAALHDPEDEMTGKMIGVVDSMISSWATFQVLSMPGWEIGKLLVPGKENYPDSNTDDADADTDDYDPPDSDYDFD